MDATTDKKGQRFTGKIGYLLRMYPRFSQTFVVNEILELERQGLDLRIASLRLPNEGRFHESATRVQAAVDYLPDRLRGQVWRRIGRQLKWLRREPRKYVRAAGVVARYRTESWFEMIQAVELLRWARKHRVRHVHVHFGTDEASVALLANMIGGLSYSLTLHAFDIFRDNVDHRLLAQKINASRFTVTVCESNRRYLLERVPGVTASKIHVVHNGIDLERFSPNGVHREPMSVFTVGRLIEKKGLIHLVRAAALLKERSLPVDCCIAGEGPERDRLLSEIARLNLQNEVRLVGPLEQDAVREHLQRASCFVLPCVRAQDGNVDALPTVLLESIACGCPTISTELSGIPEIIENDQSGLLVPTDDASSLAKAMERVLTDDALRERLGAGGRHRALDRFNVASNVSALNDLLRSAAAGKEPRNRTREEEPSVPQEQMSAIEAA